MDLNITIHRLHPNAKYRLSKANPPHKIVEWKELFPEPSNEELVAEWEKYQQEMSILAQEREDFKSTSKKFQAILEGEARYIEIYLKEIY